MRLPLLALIHHKPTRIAFSLALSIMLLTGCYSDSVSEVASPVIRPALIETVSASHVSGLTLNGTVQSSSSAELSFRHSGRLVKLLVKEGDQVEKGMLLARLDSEDAETHLASAQVEKHNTLTEYQRAKSIFESSQAISKSQLEEIEMRFKLASLRLDEAKRRLADTRLIAPFDGIISRKHKDSHVLVQANEAVLSIHDLSDMEVVIDVPEKLMVSGEESKGIVGQIPTLSNQHFELVLKNYSTKPDPVTQTYSVTLGFANLNNASVLPGMAVRVFSKLDSRGQVSIFVPLSSVQPDNQGQQYVWVVNPQHKLEKRLINTGELRGDRVEVISNLQAGEQIVVAGTANLSENLTVRPTSVEAK